MDLYLSVIVGERKNDSMEEAEKCNHGPGGGGVLI